MSRAGRQWIGLALAIAAACGSLVLPQPALAGKKVLSVPKRLQQQDQWCWAGAADAVLRYYSKSVQQCSMANYAWSMTTCCDNPAACNTWNYMYGTPGSLKGILGHWGVKSEAIAKAMTYSGVQKEITLKRPSIIRYGWSRGGGHFIVLRGFNTTGGLVYLMNPWPGDGYGVFTYDFVRSASDHTWTHTLKRIAKKASSASLALDAADTGTETPIVDTATPALTADERLVLDTARAGLRTWLGALPAGELAGYGFSGPHDLDAADLGAPVQIVTIDPADLRADASSLSLDGTVRPTGVWYVPIVVAGEYRSLISVEARAGGLEVVGISGAALARELGDFFRQASTEDQPSAETGSFPVKLVRIFQAGFDLLLVESGGREVFAPLRSAQRALGVGAAWLEPAQALPQLSTAVEAALAGTR